MAFGLFARADGSRPVCAALPSPRAELFDGCEEAGAREEAGGLLRGELALARPGTAGVLLLLCATASYFTRRHRTRRAAPQRRLSQSDVQLQYAGAASAGGALEGCWALNDAALAASTTQEV